MNITKHGCIDYPKNIEEFKCEQCGCEFTANDEEYYVDKANDYDGISVVGSYSATVTDMYVCSCPECHLIIRKGKQRVRDIPVMQGQPLTGNTIPEVCKGCSNHPSNGGSGNCNCILGIMGQVT